MDKNLKKSYQVNESAKSDSKGLATMSAKREKIKDTEFQTYEDVQYCKQEISTPF